MAANWVSPLLTRPAWVFGVDRLIELAEDLPRHWMLVHAGDVLPETLDVLLAHAPHVESVTVIPPDARLQSVVRRRMPSLQRLCRSTIVERRVDAQTLPPGLREWVAEY